MAFPPLKPKPDPHFLTGSKREDRLLGIGIGIAWWVAGTVLMALSARMAGWMLLALLVGYIAHLFILLRRVDGSTLAVSILLTTVLLPLALALGLFGMCAVRGFRM